MAKGKFKLYADTVYISRCRGVESQTSTQMQALSTETDMADFAEFRPGHVHNHPAIINFMKRKGGRPEAIRWRMKDFISSMIHTDLTVLKN